MLKLTTSFIAWPNPGPWPLVGLKVLRFFSSGRKVLELKLNRPNWLQTSECLTRNTSKISPDVLAKSGNWKDKNIISLKDISVSFCITK